MEDHKELEQSCPADGPWLVFAIVIDRVQQSHNGGIDQSNGDGHVRRQEGVVDVGSDGEGMRKVGVVWRWRESRRFIGGWELVVGCWQQGRFHCRGGCIEAQPVCQLSGGHCAKEMGGGGEVGDLNERGGDEEVECAPRRVSGLLSQAVAFRKREGRSSKREKILKLAV